MDPVIRSFDGQGFRQINPRTLTIKQSNREAFEVNSTFQIHDEFKFRNVETEPLASFPWKFSNNSVNQIQAPVVVVFRMWQWMHFYLQSEGRTLTKLKIKGVSQRS